MPDNQWNGRLDSLWSTLLREASASHVSLEDVKADRGWYWRRLPHGAVVGLRRRPDVGPASGNRFELRIARAGELHPENEGRWRTELATFFKHFAIKEADGAEPAIMPLGSWLPIPATERDEGRTVARFVSLHMGESRPGKARCGDCGAEVEWHPSFGVHGQACTHCAIRRGRGAA